MSNRIVWNQARRGNAWVSDGAEGYWAEFPAGTSADDVMAAYLATADYTGATKTFVVHVEIEGDTAEAVVGPDGEVRQAPPGG